MHTLSGTNEPERLREEVQTNVDILEMQERKRTDRLAIISQWACERHKIKKRNTMKSLILAQDER